MEKAHGDRQTLSVIVPAVSETDSLLRTVETIKAVCTPEDVCEIIIARACFGSRACAQTVERILSEESPIPISLYLQTGTFEAAIRDLIGLVKGTYFIFQPADLEEDPESLRPIIRLLNEHPGALVTASRFRAEDGFCNEGLLRKALFYPYSRFVRLLYRTNITDSTLLYQAVPTRAARETPLRYKSYAVLYELTLRLISAGVPVVEFPLVVGKRRSGASNVGFFAEGFRYLSVLFKVKAG